MASSFNSTAVPYVSNSHKIVSEKTYLEGTSLEKYDLFNVDFVSNYTTHCRK